MPLSDVQIRSLKPRDRIYKISDANSLYLEVHPTGARLWRFKYNWHGKQKRIALGAYLGVGLLPCTYALSDRCGSGTRSPRSIRHDAQAKRGGSRVHPT